MKKLVLFFIVFLVYASSNAQGTGNQAHILSRISVNVNADFQGYGLPFSTIETYRKNKGLSVGMAYSYNKKGSLQQLFKAGKLYSSFHGTAQHVSSSLQYNPVHGKNITAGVSLGAGYMRSRSLIDSWQQKPNDEWFQTANEHGFLFIPASAQLSVKAIKGNQFDLSPVISYQANALINYSPASFVIPQSVISVGIKINFKHQ